MITLRETKEKIDADRGNWAMYLMDFVDSFRRDRDPKMLAEPFDSKESDRYAALLASTAEALCDELGLDVPEWLEQVPAAKDPFFVSGLESLKAISLVESPLRFRIRKVFVLENFLNRA